ncbi:Glycosyltransferase family 61 protein [Pleurotus pulmonarius]
MGWLEPPTRRELTLLLFSITTFVLFYNLDNSIRQLGLDPISKQGAVFSKLGLGGPSIIGSDGRRPAEWRDSLEKFIYGEWHWDEGHTAGDERTKVLSGDIYGALWHDRGKIDDVRTEEDGEMHDVLEFWGSNVPTTRLIRHVPGFTVLDNVFMYNKSLVVVTDFPERFPAIGTPSIPVVVISPAQAPVSLGRYGGKVRGVTWLSTDSKPDNTTLLSLWRTYSSLDPSIDSLGRTTLPPPRRLILPHIPIYSDREPSADGREITQEELLRIPRQRSDTGFHPLLAKIAFPSMGLLYEGDWVDYHEMGTPFKLERIVVANMEAAARALPVGRPPLSSPFELVASPHWLEPVRRPLQDFFETLSAESRRRKGKVAITYLHRQWDHTGTKIKTQDHLALIDGLRQLQRDLGHDVFIVSSLDHETSWFNRMNAISQSKIILGVHGSHLLDSAFLQPSERTMVMEFYPTGTFSSDRQILAKSLGMNYSAWWGNREFTNEEIPAVSPPHDQEVPVDAAAVIRRLREVLSRT